jgi:AcrR family transcriptional regulator
MSNKIRDKQATKKRLLEAAVSLLTREGFESLGVNAVAQEAGVSKVLIYRYFGSLEGLFDEVGRKVDPASIGSITDVVRRRLAEGRKPSEVLEEALLQLIEQLHNDPLTRELLVWELSGDNELTRAFAKVREEAGLSLNSIVRSSLPDGVEVDIEAILALISSGFYYLFLRSRFVSQYNGIAIQSTAGWRRVARSAGLMLEGAISRARALTSENHTPHR